MASRDSRAAMLSREYMRTFAVVQVADRDLDVLQRKHAGALQVLAREEAYMIRVTHSRFGSETGTQRMEAMVKWATRLINSRDSVRAQVESAPPDEKDLVIQELRLLEQHMETKGVERILADIQARQAQYREACSSIESDKSRLDICTQRQCTADQSAQKAKDSSARAQDFLEASRTEVEALEASLASSQRRRITASRAVALRRKAQKARG